MRTHFAGPPTVVPTGLLEQALLRVRAADPDGRRSIEDGAGRASGIVRRMRRGWLPWGEALAVYEAFEEPIVFRVRRLWALRPRWRVVDADGESVGTVAPAHLLDRWDQVVFRRAGRGRFVLADGTPAADWAADREGGALTLHEAVRGDPFAKMLLLAAVLVA